MAYNLARRDSGRRTSLIAVVIGRITGRLDPVSGGRLLLAFTGAAVLVSSLLIAPSAASWRALMLVSAVMAVVLGGSFVLDWRRLPERATLAFPFAVFAAMVALALTTHGLTSAFVGLLTGAYVYSAITQGPGTSMLIVPFGSATFVTMNGGLSHEVAIRLVIGVMVNTVIIELLAALIRSQRQQAEVLARAADTDALTGLGNRRDLDLRLAGATPGDTLVLFDLDHFKRVNDTHGHLTGDRVLADFGRLLRLELRAVDFPARFGGEEFLVILPATDLDEATAVAERLRAGWALWQSDVTFSAGVATCRADRPAAETLAAADAALYAAKAGGRNVTRTELSCLAA